MRDSAESDYEEVRCRFDYFADDGDWSIDSEFSFERNGMLHHALLRDSTGNVYQLIHRLHELMKDHTGGDWNSVVISVDASGRAHTTFTYNGSLPNTEAVGKPTSSR